MTEVSETTDNNSKTEDAVVDDKTKATLEAVKERLRFFFSDANVRQDSFLRKFLLKEEEDDTKKALGVPVDVLLRFNTIKKLTESPDVVVQAARELDTILTVTTTDEKTQEKEDSASKDGTPASAASNTLIGRVDPFIKAKMDENIPLTLYLSNLPTNKEQRRYTHTADDIRQLFGDNDHGIVLVKFRFRTDGDQDNDDDLDLSKQEEQPGYSRRRRVPLGAALVEFESLEKLQRAAADTLTTTTSKDGGETVPPKKVLSLGDTVLQVQLLKDYIESRKSNKRKSKDKDKEEPIANAFVLDWKPGCVVSIQGFPSDCDREAILDAVAGEMGLTVDQLKKDHKIYADFSRGQSDGAIRFAEPSDAIAKIRDKLVSGEMTVGGAKVVSASILEGDEEKKYWDDFIAFKNKQMQQRERERSSRKKSRRH